jgi:putative ABC transport system substrate-binding protein
MRRIGVLWPTDENDPVRKVEFASLAQALAERGWKEGRNLRIDVRWNPRTADEVRRFAKELVDMQPDLLVTSTIRLTRAAQQATQTIPIVMIGAGDPLSSGLVKSLSHPEGNTTGVTDIFESIAGNWLEFLRECAPGLARAALIFNPDIGNAVFIDSATSAAAKAGVLYGVKTIKTPYRNAEEIGRAIVAFAAEPDGGLIVVPPAPLSSERQVINRMAVQYRLPVIYQDRSLAVEGGLLSYGADLLHMFRHDAPPYIDRILRGAKPGDLPVQFPTRFTLVVNLKTAKAMGLAIPASFLLRADEVIE